MIALMIMNTVIIIMMIMMMMIMMMIIRPCAPSGPTRVGTGAIFDRVCPLGVFAGAHECLAPNSRGVVSPRGPRGDRH